LEASLTTRRKRHSLAQASGSRPRSVKAEQSPASSGHAWKIEVNDRYQRVVDLLISLATGALVLPPLFLKEFLGVKDEPIALFLDYWAYVSLAGFASAILFGILFHYTSAKWVKHAYDRPVRFLGSHLEVLLEWLFWLTVVTFVLGIVCFVQFVLHS
jgi:hypothetical protein